MVREPIMEKAVRVVILVQRMKRGCSRSSRMNDPSLSPWAGSVAHVRSRQTVPCLLHSDFDLRERKDKAQMPSRNDQPALTMNQNRLWGLTQQGREIVHLFQSQLSADPRLRSWWVTWNFSDASISPIYQLLAGSFPRRVDYTLNAVKFDCPGKGKGTHLSRAIRSRWN